MYRNYGDVNFLEHGCLIDSEHSDTVFDMLLCEPYSDEEDMYQFAHVQVDIEDPWINREGVMNDIGMTEDTFDPIFFARGCVSYYSWDNFGAADYGVTYNWQRCDEKTIREELKHCMIAWDNLRVGDE